MTRALRLLAALVVLGVATAGLCVSCTGGASTSQSARPVLDRVFPTPKVLTAAPSSTPGVEVYFDGSGSCAGFTRGSDGTSGRNEYCSFVGALRVWLANSSLRCYKFGAMDRPEEIGGPLAATQEGFHDQSETRLVELFDLISARATLPEGILVVTDGAPSTRSRKDLINMVRPVARLIGRGVSVQVLGVKSGFCGPVYSETQGCSRVGIYRGQRPFYCFVVASSPNFGQRLSQMLAAKKIAHNLATLSFVPSEPGGTEFDVPTKLPDGARNPLRRYAADGNLVHLMWRPEAGASARGSVGVKHEIHLAAGWSDVRPGAGGVRDTQVCIDASTGMSSPSECRLMSSGLSAGSAKSLAMDVQFLVGRTEGHDRVAYKILLYPTAMSFRLPGWVEEWSTDQDSRLSDFAKTLYLDDFAEAIMTEGCKQVPLAVLYLNFR